VKALTNPTADEREKSLPKAHPAVVGTREGGSYVGRKSHRVTRDIIPTSRPRPIDTAEGFLGPLPDFLCKLAAFLLCRWKKFFGMEMEVEEEEDMRIYGVFFLYGGGFLY